MMQRREFDPPRGCPTGGLFPLEWFLTSLPTTLSDECKNTRASLWGHATHRS